MKIRQRCSSETIKKKLFDSKFKTNKKSATNKNKQTNDSHSKLESTILNMTAWNIYAFIMNNNVLFRLNFESELNLAKIAKMRLNVKREKFEILRKKISG